MTSQSGAASRPETFSNYPSSQTSRPFFVGLLAIALVLLTAGIGAFWYLVATGPLSVFFSSDRPVAITTAFVPADAPFTFSLLTNPDNLVAQQQALPNADPQAVLEAARQIEQAFFKDSLIDYDRDIRPWLGNEVTIAYTDLDLDFDETTGQQPGYLLALEITPGRSQQAKESLQLFWQRQSLAGNRPQSEQLNGVRMLVAPDTVSGAARSGRSVAGQSQRVDATMGAASALVGNQFVLFANDARVIRRSLRATETATNLAQSRSYRTAAEKLPPERLGLVHLNTAAFSKLESAPSTLPSFVTVGLELMPTGIAVTAQLPESAFNQGAVERALDQSDRESTALLRFIPAESAITFTSQNLSQLEPAIAASGLPITLPDFLKLSLPDSNAESPLQTMQSPWQWAKGDYAIAQTQSGKDDWILVVERTADGVAQMDEFAKSQGYSVAPLTLGEQDAIAWTKLKTRAQRRQSGSTLETEILGLHLQPKTLSAEDSSSDRLQDGYEIFASSVAAMDDALNASAKSLLSDRRFVHSNAAASNAAGSSPEGFLYMDWSVIAPMLAQRSELNNVASALRPITRQIDSLTANKLDHTLNLFIRFKHSPSE